MNLLKNLISVFYPTSCACCDAYLSSNEMLICVSCRHDLPFFDNNDFKNNKLQHVFTGRIPLEETGSFLEFYKHGKVKNLIHQLKYKGNQDIGHYLGIWWGSQLAKSDILSQIDCIIPVPLDKKKQKKRGYNQLTSFGHALSKQLQIPYNDSILIKKTGNSTQTYKKRFDRFLNTETIFELKDDNVFYDQHILLIDDVITTGATIESCCKALLKTEKIKISVLSIAFTV